MHYKTLPVNRAYNLHNWFQISKSVVNRSKRKPGARFNVPFITSNCNWQYYRWASISTWSRNSKQVFLLLKIFLLLVLTMIQEIDNPFQSITSTQRILTHFKNLIWKRCCCISLCLVTFGDRCKFRSREIATLYHDEVCQLKVACIYLFAC